MKVGDKVVCIKKDNWVIVHEGLTGNNNYPKYNEIVEIKSIKTFKNIKYVELVGYINGYNIRNFAPIEPKKYKGSELIKKLANIKIHEERLEEIKIPSLT